MAKLTRRRFVGHLGGLTALALSGFSTVGRAAYKSRVIVVGGGYGGATAAKYLRLADPRIEVILIEKNKAFVSCPGSNEVLSGERAMEELTFGYGALADHYGVRLVHDEVVGIDPETRTVTAASGNKLGYDRLIISPGIELDFQSVEGYTEGVAAVVPHAWQAGRQTMELRRQLEEMDDGGTVIIAVPPRPFRCPTAPFERASQIAYYLKSEKPGARIIILDANDDFPKQQLFEHAWKQYYPEIITRVPGISKGKVTAIDPKTRAVFTASDAYHGDVVNLIPPQRAGKIARGTGLTGDDGWCSVDQRTFESTVHAGIHVIGDACAAGAMPKTAYAANSQAKVCAQAVAALLNGSQPAEPSFLNSCYSLVTPEHGISMVTVYRVVDGTIVDIEGAGGMSPADTSELDRILEARYARGWLEGITNDTFS